MNVVILDTGCANLNSVKSAIGRHGYEPVVSRDPEVVLRADKLFLPGVGTAQAAMDQLRDRELIDSASDTSPPFARSRTRPSASRSSMKASSS